MLGLALVFVATQSPLEHYGNQLLWADFGGMLLLTMIAPPLILLGSPLTLAFRASGPRGRARLRRLYRGRTARIVAMPIVSWLLFAVVTYAWQFMGITEDAAANVFVRDVQQLSLFAVSLLFWWPALCADPVAWRMNHPTACPLRRRRDDAQGAVRRHVPQPQHARARDLCGQHSLPGAPRP